MNTEQTEKAKKAAGFVAGLLTGWGVPANWARIITGAIIGAVAAIAAMTGTGCTASYTQKADGTIQYNGALVPIVEPTSK